MSDSKTYDYIFAGFGLSGMTLLYELSKDPGFARKSVLVIDKDDKKSNDRTWSFWSNEPNEFQHLAKKSWKKGLFYDLDRFDYFLDLEEYTYYTIEGSSFYEFMHAHFAKFDNIVWKKENIRSVSELGSVTTDSGAYSGNLVFRSYFERKDFENQPHKYFLWQHFYGYVLKTDKPSFKTERFTLMDYQFGNPIRTNFFYVLPYSETEALVEFTEFSIDLYNEEHYKYMLELYIHRYMKVTDYDLVLKEFNAIPMSDFQLKNFVSDKLINIGSLAGYVKPSSGYAFTRTIERNKKLAHLILNNLPRREKDLNSTRIYKAFDNALLYLIANKKVHGGRIFGSLFADKSADFVFRFLDEKATKRELWEVMMASPKKWEFIKYFLKHWGR